MIDYVTIALLALLVLVALVVIGAVVVLMVAQPRDDALADISSHKEPEQ